LTLFHAQWAHFQLWWGCKMLLNAALVRLEIIAPLWGWRNHPDYVRLGIYANWDLLLQPKCHVQLGTIVLLERMYLPHVQWAPCVILLGALLFTTAFLVALACFVQRQDSSARLVRVPLDTIVQKD
jgi:hypothetical protein